MYLEKVKDGLGSYTEAMLISRDQRVGVIARQRDTALADLAKLREDFESMRDRKNSIVVLQQHNAELLELLRETEHAIIRHQAEQPMSRRLSGNLDKARGKIKSAIKQASGEASNGR